MTDQTDIQVVGTISFLTDFAEALLGSEASYHSIIKGSQDPHFVEPSAEDLTKLEDADIIFALGLDAIDRWILNFVNENSELSNKVVYAIDLNSVLREDPVVDAINPHFWLSPIHAKTMVSNMAEELIGRNLGVSQVNTNLPTYLDLLDGLLNQISALATQFNGTKVVEDHPAFMYLADLLGLDRIGALEEREGVDPSPLHVQQLSDKMQENGVKLILASKTQAGSDVQELARMAGAKIAFFYSVPGNSDAKTYIEMISYNLASLQNPVPPTAENDLPMVFFPILVGLFIMATIQRRKI